MKINNKFDGGSIEVINNTDPRNIFLKLTSDNRSTDCQWFYFDCEVEKSTAYTMSIINAAKSSFAKAWQGYQALASYDKKHWFRVKTHFEDDKLVISHRPKSTKVSYAYFVPYSYQQHQTLLQTAVNSPLGSLTSLGKTPDGNSIDLLTIQKSGDNNKQQVWLTARQHPGETMSQWFIEGLINRLLSEDELSKKILERCVFHIVVNMNIDGSIRGNHRTNAKGFNLNRQWQAPSKIDVPEVYFVQQAMLDKGVDLFIDVHGDEEIPYNFIMGSNASCQLRKQAKEFKSNFAESTTDFQIAVDYDSFNYGQSSCASTACCNFNNKNKEQSKARDYVEHQFGCLSLLLEMPFIDNASTPRGDIDCATQRYLDLGAAILEPIYEHLHSS
jgi:murein tripeptide amidase MpaA